MLLWESHGKSAVKVPMEASASVVLPWKSHGGLRGSIVFPSKTPWKSHRSTTKPPPWGSMRFRGSPREEMLMSSCKSHHRSLHASKRGCPHGSKRFRGRVPWNSPWTRCTPMQSHASTMEIPVEAVLPWKSHGSPMHVPLEVPTEAPWTYHGKIIVVPWKSRGILKGQSSRKHRENPYGMK